MLYDKELKVGSDGGVRPDRPAAGGQGLATQIMDSLEQGVMFWSKDGVSVMYNARAHIVLEMDPVRLSSGVSLADFLQEAVEYGGMPAADNATLLDRFKLGVAFKFQLTSPSGRTIAANVRPVRGGGHIVAFTDISDMIAATTALAQAKAEAAEAQKQADEILRNERARQNESLLLAQLDEWLQSCRSLTELYEIVTIFMGRVLPETRGQLFIYSNSRDILELSCAWNCDHAQEQVTPDSCWALRRGRAYTFDPDALSFACDHTKEIYDGASPGCRTMCIPIVAHGDTAGMLHFEFLVEGPNDQIQDPQVFTTRCGEHISLAIANVKLRDELQDQSTRDPLTGLYNRRHFLEAMRKELAQTAACQGNFALLSLDADKFKLFNDDHGHDAGDAVLEAIAEKMLALEFPGAIACRVGGEEFSIILPKADRTRATAAAEELRSAIEDTRVKYIGGPLPKVTISLGIAVYPTHGTSAQDLIKSADVALYEAKKAGRNCYKVSESDESILF